MVFDAGLSPILADASGIVPVAFGINPSEEGKRMVTIEVAGQAIAVTDASAEQARALFQDDEFRLSLLAIAPSGGSFWHSDRAFTIRPAMAEEVAAFDASLEDNASEEGINVLFLVPLDEGLNRTLH